MYTFLDCQTIYYDLKHIYGYNEMALDTIVAK